MSILLVQGCSKSKKPAKEPIPAFELYTGYFFKIIKKAMREGECRSDLDVCILSAKYGMLDAATRITEYDLRMDRDTAVELREEVVAELQAKIEDGDYEYVVLNLGSTYQQAVTGLETKVEVPVVDIQGQLGVRGQTLKQFIRGKEKLEASV